LKTILIFGAGKSATILISYLLGEAEKNNWKLIIADANRDQVLAKTKQSPYAEALQMDITNDEERSKQVQRAHIVISMMPPSLHFLIAKDCVEYRKHLLTASYVDEKIKSLRDEINDRKLLFLCEMGLDPGIDHMSAMKIIDGIRETGANIVSFKSHCGGLVAKESDNNPWCYKVSWNPRNIVLAGNSGAEFKMEGKIKKVDYADLFNEKNIVRVKGVKELSYYPNRDSLAYIPLYNLPNARTFMRTTLRFPEFMLGWKALVQAGLTDDTKPIDPTGLTFAMWAEPVLRLVTNYNRRQLFYLGIFDDQKFVPATAKTSADILQFLVETKLAMTSRDKDMIVMMHEFEYEHNGYTKFLQSSLIVTGEDNVRTAMAKTVGLPLGIAAKLILSDELLVRGLHIPTIKDIYEPVLRELENEGIRFTEQQNLIIRSAIS
jgi:saccharopine dehydrogenase (NADP+, L-glutamate forming)